MMTTRITVPFTITGWDQTPYDEPTAGPALARATVRKAFSGELDATSVAELLLCAPDDAHAGYLGQERVTGQLAGRAGTFVIQHGGIVDGQDQRPFGTIVPASATGALRGLRGTATFMHDADGARVQLDYEFVTEA